MWQIHVSWAISSSKSGDNQVTKSDNRIHIVIYDLNVFSAAFLRPPTSPTLTYSSPHPPPEEGHYDETYTRKLQFTSTRGTGFIMAAFP